MICTPVQASVLTSIDRAIDSFQQTTQAHHLAHFSQSRAYTGGQIPAENLPQLLTDAAQTSQSLHDALGRSGVGAWQPMKAGLKMMSLTTAVRPRLHRQKAAPSPDWDLQHVPAAHKSTSTEFPMLQLQFCAKRRPTSWVGQNCI